MAVVTMEPISIYTSAFFRKRSFENGQKAAHYTIRRLAEEVARLSKLVDRQSPKPPAPTTN